jgi:hypothetical protein
MSASTRRRRSSVPCPDVIATLVVASGDRELASRPLIGGGRPARAVVDELARLQLAARRLGLCIRLRDPSPELVQLLYVVGLGDVLPRDCRLRVEVSGEAEHLEQPGVEEVVVPDDPVP